MFQNFSNFQNFKFLNFKISKSILKSAVLPASLMPLFLILQHPPFKQKLGSSRLDHFLLGVPTRGCQKWKKKKIVFSYNKILGKDSVLFMMITSWPCIGEVLSMKLWYGEALDNEALMCLEMFLFQPDLQVCTLYEKKFPSL